MSECGFEKDLGNGMKMSILGLAVGALGWLIFGAAKGGRSYEAARRPRPAAQASAPQPKKKSSSGWTTAGT